MRILAIAIIFISFNSYAKNYYISGVQKITFRSGPGTDNKILKMLDTDSKVIMLEEGSEWSKIKDADGEEGYVLNRFLDTSVPYSLRYQWLKSEYEKLKETNQENLDVRKELEAKLSKTAKELESTNNKYAEVVKSYEDLKKGSANYLDLKQKYEQTNMALDKTSDQVKGLESKLVKYYIYWFLAGAGVLILGWIIGGISRKKKSYGSSIRL